MKSADLSENVEYFKEKSQVEKERGIYQVLSLIDEFPKCQSRFVDWRPHFEPAARGAFFSNWRGQPIKIVQGICTQAIITMIFELFERNKKKKTIIFWLEKNRVTQFEENWWNAMCRSLHESWTLKR